MNLRSCLLLAFLAAAPVFAQTGATPAEKLTVAPGFKVELLKSATSRDGSWVSMAIDAKGRLFISPQGAIPESGFAKDSQWGGLVRVTLDEKGQIAKWERVPVPVGDAMGMLWAFDSLYVSGNGPAGRGIYRLKDGDGDDALETATLFKAVPGGAGEHGAHALVLGPDGKSIYIVHGNSTPLIEGVAPDSPYRNYRDDDLLPRVLDPVATFFDKIKSPYGYVLRTDENGTRWELIAGGFRNPYDIDFNADGDLFTYDSDMEWDMGLPWYRPTRVLHVIPGGEYGFREGSAKWPASYLDSLPATVDIGLGCPTGVKFGTRSNFPAKYKRAFFIQDWTFGRILAVHLHPQGAGYTAKNGPMPPYKPTGPTSGEDVEVFVSGKGLPVTDLEFGNDGAMYFTIGGRGTQAGLYRVSRIEGDASADGDAATPAKAPTPEEAGMRHVRRLLEKRPVDLDALKIAKTDAAGVATPLRGNAALAAVATVSLRRPDRHLQFAGRMILEERPTGDWRDFALAQTDARIAFSALVSLARVGTKEDQAAVLKALAKFPLDSLNDELKLEKLRVIEVALARHGRPADELVQMGIDKLGRQYPAKSFALNRELCQLLVYLGAPDVVEKTLGLMDASTEPAEQVWYALCLREAMTWTPPQRERYFAWFAKARAYKGGNSFAKFILRVREQALAKVPEAERPALLALAENEQALPKVAVPPVAARAFVKAWTLDDLLPALPEAEKGRNFARGKALYTAVQCAQCHLFAGEGGAVGPDLTAVGSRFSRKDILDAILEPSKALSEQYASFLFTMTDGTVIGGQIADENNDHIALITDPINGTKQLIQPRRIKSREMSPVSLMPPGLLSTLSKEEVLDLLAYMESGGNEKAPAFSTTPAK